MSLKTTCKNNSHSASHLFEDDSTLVKSIFHLVYIPCNMNIISSFFSLPLSLPLSVFCILLNSHNCQFLESNVIFSFSYVGTFGEDFTTSVDIFETVTSSNNSIK